MGATVQKFNTPGSHNVVIDSSNSITGSNSIHVEVNTTLGAINLILPPISNYGSAYNNVLLTVYDKGGVASTNNITITPDPLDKVNNASSVVINTNKGVMEMEVIDANNWSADLEQGSAGGSSLSPIGAFYQRVTDVAGTIASNNGKVLFQTPSSNNTVGAFTMVPASGDILVNTTGKYEINWGVSGAEPNAFGIFIGAGVVAGTVEGSGAGTQQNRGSALVSLTAGDVVSLRTVDCPAAVTLQLAGTTNTAQNVASITFKKVG